MCNGANLAYTKHFSGVERLWWQRIASGDDVFLLQKAVAQFPYKVHYLKSKNNIVTTGPLNDWKSFSIKESTGLKNNFLSKQFWKTIGSCCFNGNLCWLLVVGSGHLGCANWSCNNFIPTNFQSTLFWYLKPYFSGTKLTTSFSSLLYPFLVFAWPFIPCLEIRMERKSVF
jgi:hypothetical protein